MKKILMWYIDENGDTRIQILDMPPGYLVETLIYEFSTRPAVRTVIEAYTLKATHTIFDTKSNELKITTTEH